MGSTRGWTSVSTGIVGTAVYSLLGPFHPGQMMDRLAGFMRASSTQVLTIGAVITKSTEATPQAWRSGAPIIDRSTVSANGQPVMQLSLGPNNAKNIYWAVGRPVSGGPVYVVCRAVRVSGSGTLDVMMTMFCSKVER
jgi:hypothetical protein